MRDGRFRRIGVVTIIAVVWTAIAAGVSLLLGYPSVALSLTTFLLVEVGMLFTFLVLADELR